METWERVSVHWQQGKYLYDLIASCAGRQFRMRVSESQDNSATRYHAGFPNHSAMTSPSKSDWH